MISILSSLSIGAVGIRRVRSGWRREGILLTAAGALNATIMVEYNS